MRELDLCETFDGGAAADSVGGGRPFADAVDGEHRGLRETGEEEGGGRVRGVVRVGADRPLPPEPLADRPLRPPRIEPGEIAPRPLRSPRPELAGELVDRPLVVGDAVDLIDPDPPRLQAEAERLNRQPRVVLDPREPLLLGRRHQHPVAQQAARRFVEEGGEAEDVHGTRDAISEPPLLSCSPAMPPLRG